MAFDDSIQPNRVINLDDLPFDPVHIVWRDDLWRAGLVAALRECFEFESLRYSEAWEAIPLAGSRISVTVARASTQAEIDDLALRGENCMVVVPHGCESWHTACLTNIAGFVLEDSAPRVIVESILSAARGEFWLDPRLQTSLLTTIRHYPRRESGVCEFPLRNGANANGRSPKLGQERHVDPLRRDSRALTRISPREHDVLSLLADAQTNSEIARCLNLQYTTVKSHVSSILRKLGLPNRESVVAFACLYSVDLSQPGRSQ